MALFLHGVILEMILVTPEIPFYDKLQTKYDYAVSSQLRNQIWHV